MLKSTYFQKKLLFSLPLLLILNGCGGPSNKDIATLGLIGSVSILVLSWLITAVFLYLFIRKKHKILWSSFLKKRKLYFYSALGILGIEFIILIVVGIINKSYGGDLLEGGVEIFLMGSIGALVICGFAVIVYSLIFLLLFSLIPKLRNYLFITPFVITLLYVLTLTVVFFFDKKLGNHAENLINIWVLWVYLLSFFN